METDTKAVFGYPHAVSRETNPSFEFGQLSGSEAACTAGCHLLSRARFWFSVSLEKPGLPSQDRLRWPSCLQAKSPIRQHMPMLVGAVSIQREI